MKWVNLAVKNPETGEERVVDASALTFMLTEEIRKYCPDFPHYGFEAEYIIALLVLLAKGMSLSEALEWLDRNLWDSTDPKSVKKMEEEQIAEALNELVKCMGISGVRFYVSE